MSQHLFQEVVDQTQTRNCIVRQPRLHFRAVAILVAFVVALAAITIPIARVSAAAAPSVTSFTGTPWSFSCSNSTWNNYLQVGYEGYSTITVSANGSGLDQVSSVTTTASGYKVSISSKTSSKLTLNIQGKALAGAPPYFNETSPRPVANFPLKFNYSSGSFSKNITPGVIPAFNSGLQAWGQCTWYAGYIARLSKGKTVVSSYGSCASLSGDPNNAGFPKQYSVLNASGKHMAFLENISSTSKTNSDGSVTVTYKLSGSQYNADCKGSKTSFTDVPMVVNKKNGAYTITTTPTVVYAITGVKQ